MRARPDARMGRPDEAHVAARCSDVQSLQRLHPDFDSFSASEALTMSDIAVLVEAGL
jgi:hypothetical protein